MTAAMSEAMSGPTKGTILVVDDDRQMAKTLSAVLKLHGWIATAAYSGEEAIRATETRAFDAVLMDVKMPGINGVDAFRAIRRARPRMPVILMTAYAAHDLLEQAEREGVLMIMPKPISWPALLELLDQNRANPRSVLIVDDDPAFLVSIGDVIAAHGMPVIRAESLPQALRYLEDEESPPAVVVLDLKLNGLEPTEAAVAIKACSPTVALILCTGHPVLLDETMAALPSEWVHAALTKPFPPERLVNLLNALHP